MDATLVLAERGSDAVVVVVAAAGVRVTVRVAADLAVTAAVDAAFVGCRKADLAVAALGLAIAHHVGRETVVLASPDCQAVAYCVHVTAMMEMGQTETKRVGQKTGADDDAGANSRALAEACPEQM